MALKSEDLKARNKAIKSGKLRYIRPSDGLSYDIRNLNNPRVAHLYQGQGGRDERTERRRANRGETNSTRQQKINKLTPDKNIRDKTETKISRLKGRNFQGHHVNKLDFSSKGYDEILATKGKLAADAWVKKQTKLGNPVDHSPENITGYTRKEHIKYHSSLGPETQRQNGIASANGSFKGLRLRPGGLPKLIRTGSRSNMFGLAFDAVDAQTNGAVTNGINGAIENGLNGIKNGVNGFAEHYKNGVNNISQALVKNGLYGLTTLNSDGSPNYGQNGD